MFSGRVELFEGLAAEEWVARQAERPSPVLRFDMSQMDTSDVKQLSSSLSETLQRQARDAEIDLASQTLVGMLQDIIIDLYRRHGPIVVLIDEYDKPILDHISDVDAAEAMRGVLRSFYTVLKGCDEYLRFVMLTGISKFSKAGVFSAMNNLRDISMSESYGDIVGYTQAELDEAFSGWIDAMVEKMGSPRTDLLERIKAYYDGFCFDGATRLYCPFSMLNFFADGKFANHWYRSGSPSFIVKYMRRHSIQDPDAYRHIEVDQDFADAHEIERARPESFLYQAGYLTIEKWEGRAITLDYPNREVLDSISRVYLEMVYRVEGYVTLGSKLWTALRDGDIGEAVRLYDVALAGIPYQDFGKQDEFLYRSLFLMLLRGAGVEAYGEVQTSRGRPDVLILFADRVVVLEFKFTKDGSKIAELRREGERQIEARGYARPFDADRRAVTTAVIVIDGEEHEAVL